MNFKHNNNIHIYNICYIIIGILCTGTLACVWGLFPK